MFSYEQTSLLRKLNLTKDKFATGSYFKFEFVYSCIWIHFLYKVASLRN